MLRDVLLREVPTVLRHELYAIPALLGAGVVVVAQQAGNLSPVFPILGAGLCFAMRLVGLRTGSTSRSRPASAVAPADDAASPEAEA